MNPWDIKVSNGKKPEDSFIVPLWSKFSPKDFYFATQEIDGATVVYLVPSEYYENNGRMFDDSMPIIQFLPEYLEETLEGVYETGTPIDIVNKDMLTKGFYHNHFFQQFIDGNTGVFSF